ncbi:hypothetical protein GIB67_020450 [Kingdonia uniflora]|uniref:ATP synthase 24 kDa subunit, mitochondrial n=1 Tax=Kingdonia uniflora TaxID=39325 RepID=A0A7J7LUM8_9MAGN|nr:hypothetical protein GIB67_020450 [Kingdonia uniflora]
MYYSISKNSVFRQFYAGQIIPHQSYGVPLRFFAEEAAATGLKGDEMLKNIFSEVKNKFETAIGVLRKEKITIDPNDPAAVAGYAKVVKTIRENFTSSNAVVIFRLIDGGEVNMAGLLSESQRIQYTIKTKTEGIPDARTYLLTLKEIRVKRGLNDELGVETMMMDALEKVEKELKKPLMRSDKKGMALLMAEFDKVNKKLGIRKEDLPKYEDQLELKIAKAQLEEIKKDALETMQTQKKREEFQDEPMVDVKSLDIRNFL